MSLLLRWPKSKHLSADDNCYLKKACLNNHLFISWARSKRMLWRREFYILDQCKSEIFWTNSKTIIGFGFRTQWGIMQISKSVSALHIILRLYVHTLVDSCSCWHDKLSGISINSNGTELEQVVHTHRTSCRSSCPKGFGELNPSQQSWIFTSLSVDSNPYSYLFTFATGPNGSADVVSYLPWVNY